MGCGCGKNKNTRRQSSRMPSAPKKIENIIVPPGTLTPNQRRSVIAKVNNARDARRVKTQTVADAVNERVKKNSGES